MLGEIFIFILIGLGGSCAVWLIVYIIRKLFKVISAVVIAALIFLALGFFYAGFSGKKQSGEEQTRNEETGQNDTIHYQQEEERLDNEENISDDKNYVYNSLRWSSYSNNRYSIHYKIKTTDLEDAAKNRSEFFGYSWTEIYQNLYLKDHEMLTSICKKYDSLQNNNNALDFARLIVSSIQEVPYTWVLVESCYDAPNRNEIQQSGYQCLGNIKSYAVQSPVEFLSNLKGDCDTKTVALYTILKKFNYDVSILISEQYKHCVLGINLPANGKCIEQFGKRYYLWETTVKGLDVGQMPPEYSNMSFWEIVL